MTSILVEATESLFVSVELNDDGSRTLFLKN